MNNEIDNSNTPTQQTKTIGVVIPIYNVAPYLKECLDSVINQTYKNLSIVLVNDGSTDESLDIAKEYTSKDSRFILIDKQNGGQSTARNVGIDWFKNNYEAKLDSIYKINENKESNKSIESNALNSSPQSSKETIATHTTESKQKDSMLSNNTTKKQMNIDSTSIASNTKNQDSTTSQINQTIQNNTNDISNTSNTTNGGVTLYTYTITNNNPYNIYKIYASSHAHNNYINHTQNLNTNNNTNTHNINKTDSTNYIQTNITNNIESNQAQKENHNNTQEQHKQTHKLKKEQQTKDTQQTQQPNQTLAPTHIDYIIFLDSDDYWKPNCIEECVKHSNGVEIVWFDYEWYFDCVEHPKTIWKTQPETLGLVEGKLSKQEWLYKLQDGRALYFSFVVQGLTDFSYLKKINHCFVDNTFAEDHLYGTLLFLQSENIYFINKHLYIYRIRPNSSCNFNKQKVYIPKFFEPFVEIFKTREMTREYYIASSWCMLLLDFITFLQNNKEEYNEIVIRLLFPHYVAKSLKLLDFKHDPLGLIPKLTIIEPYITTRLRYEQRVRIRYPKKYKILKPLFTVYNTIKLIERTIRKKLKANPPPPLLSGIGYCER